VLVLLLPKGVYVGTKGSLRVTFLPTNKVEIFEQISKAFPPFLFLSLSFSLLKLSSKKKSHKKTKTLQRSIGQGCNVLPTIVATAPRVIVLPAITAVASYNVLPALS
jgi:hypothetical protein